jgi:hypothetical protein
MVAPATVAGILLTGIHSARPAATAVGGGTLYSCTTHSLVYQSDGATWSTWATLSSATAFTTPTVIQYARANGTNTITAMSSGQRIIVGIVSYSGTVTGVTCTNVTFTQVGTDLSFNSNKTSVWVGVATGTSGTSVTFTGSGTILNICAVVANTLTPTLGTQFSQTSSIGFLDLAAKTAAVTANTFFVGVAMADNTSVPVHCVANGAHTPIPTPGTGLPGMCLGYAPTGDLVVSGRSTSGSTGLVYAVSIT